MKKKLLLLPLLAISLLNFNCSRNDDDTTPIQNSPLATLYFHPPTWIQGKWGISPFSGGILPTFKFTNDDFLFLTAEGEQSLTGMIKSNLNKAGSVEEISNNANEYNFKIKFDVSTSLNYEFRKVSETQIQVRSSPNDEWGNLYKV